MNDGSNSSPPKNRISLVIRVLLLVLGALVAGAGVAVYSIFSIIENDNSKSLFINPNKILISSGATDTRPDLKSAYASSQPVETLEYEGKTYARNPDIVNLLFLGIDYTDDRASMNLGRRSDMMLVCAVDTAAYKVYLISLPRDTYTKIYILDSKGKIKKTGHNKLNTAYHFGENYPAENAMTCIQMFLQREDVKKVPGLNIPVYLYASIDIDGIGPVADSVGGIDVTLEYDIPGLGNEGDRVHLSGDKAAVYIRDRHHDPQGDIGRAGKEQSFMMLLAKKIKERGIVNNILALYTSLNKYVNTNLTTMQMMAFARILKDVNIDSIQKYTIPGRSQSESPYYYMPDNDETTELLLSVYYKEIG